MKAGDILLFKGEDTISSLIKWGTGSKYCHVAICVSPDLNLAIEAMAWKGVRAIAINNTKEAYDVYRVKGENSFNLNNAISYLVNRLNTGYDHLGVLFLGILKILSKIGLPLKNKANTWQKDRDYFCSELVYEAFYKGGGLDIVPDIEEADITSPGDIAKSSILGVVE